MGNKRNRDNNVDLIDFDENFFEKPVDFLDKNKKSQKSDSFLTKLIVLSVILSFVLIALIVFIPSEKFAENEGNASDSEVIARAQKNPFDFFSKRENILLLGVDSNGQGVDPFSGTRSDTIMILSLDKSTKSANVLSIPRDSKVYIAGQNGIDKINAAHALGGPELTAKTIEDMFGIKIHHYIVVNYDGVKDILRSLGNITVTVDKKLYYNDYAGKLHINLSPGVHELTPEEAEEFIRFRHDAIGDIGRIERQRIFMKGLMKKIQSPGVLQKLPDFITVVLKNVKTDMTFFDITRYAGVAANINLDDTQVATLPGHPSQKTAVSYWILEPDKAQSVIDKIIYRIEPTEVSSEPLKVSILYSSDYYESLDRIKEIIENAGAKVVCSSKTTRKSTEIIAHTNNFTTQKYKLYKNLFPELKSAHLTLSYDLFYCADSDVTLVFAD